LNRCVVWGGGLRIQEGENYKQRHKEGGLRNAPRSEGFRHLASRGPGKNPKEKKSGSTFIKEPEGYNPAAKLGRQRDQKKLRKKKGGWEKDFIERERRKRARPPCCAKSPYRRTSRKSQGKSKDKKRAPIRNPTMKRTK